ncbi:MAG: DUF6152 family protein [Pseudomonadota bacterium]
MKAKPLFAALATAALLPLSALAHHSFAMFDSSKEVELKGTVQEWQWTSPHVWLYLLVQNGGKEPDKYTIEGGNPGQLRRDGFAKGSMAPGDKVTVYMSPLRSGEKGGAITAIILPDGKMLGARLKPQP